MEERANAAFATAQRTFVAELLTVTKVEASSMPTCDFRVRLLRILRPEVPHCVTVAQLEAALLEMGLSLETSLP
eukprot:4438966-Pyramimonas_sp.AAC.1